MCIITEPNSNTINITLNFPKESILFIHLVNKYLHSLCARHIFFNSSVNKKFFKKSYYMEST